MNDDGVEKPEDEIGELMVDVIFCRVRLGPGNSGCRKWIQVQKGESPRGEGRWSKMGNVEYSS